jgi:hypothetical protein
MIPKVSRGYRIGGLIRYLMGPGRFNDHTNQQVIASWDGMPHTHQRVRNQAGDFEVGDLVDRLSEPAQWSGVPLVEPPSRAGVKLPQGPVWHCSLRNHADDRVLSDEEWAEVVAEVLHRTGIAPRGDMDGCRWVAVRHAEDHVHIAAVLVRQDGRKFRFFRDWPTAIAVCQDAERRLGLTPTAPADRTAVRQPTRAEMEKAAARGVQETSRAWLRRAARVALVQARDQGAYFAKLGDLGVMSRVRLSPAGEPVGYSLATAGDVNAAGEPVWYGGGSLAKDLTLPKLGARWASAQARTPIPPAAGELSAVGRAERSAAVTEAVSAMEHASAALAAGERAEAPGIVHAVEDMVNAVSIVGEKDRPVAWRSRAADRYQRAARSSGTGQPTTWGPVAADLRSAAWRLAAIRALVPSRRDDGGAGALVVALSALIGEVAAYHEQRQCLAQAHAARAARDVLSRPPDRPTPSTTSTGGPGRGTRGRPVSRPDVPAPVVRRRPPPGGGAGQVRGRGR